MTVLQIPEILGAVVSYGNSCQMLARFSETSVNLRAAVDRFAREEISSITTIRIPRNRPVISFWRTMTLTRKAAVDMLYFAAEHGRGIERAIQRVISIHKYSRPIFEKALLLALKNKKVSFAHRLLEEDIRIIPYPLFLDLAAFIDLGLVEKLITLGANLSASRISPQALAEGKLRFSKRRRFALFCLVLKYHRPDAMQAVLENRSDPDYLEELLRNGAKIERLQVGDRFCYPIHLAALKRSIKHLALLLHAGSDVDSLDSNGIPPIIYALHKGQIENADFLLESGASFDNLSLKTKRYFVRLARAEGFESRFTQIFAEQVQMQREEL